MMQPNETSKAPEQRTSPEVQKTDERRVDAKEFSRLGSTLLTKAERLVASLSERVQDEKDRRNFQQKNALVTALRERYDALVQRGVSVEKKLKDLFEAYAAKHSA